MDYFKMIRYFLYATGIFIFYVIERVPESLVYFFTGTRPLYLLPLVLVICVLENKKAGFMFCVLAGILMDLDCSYKLGFFTIILPFLSILLNVIFEKLITANFFSVNFFIFISVVLIFTLEFLFFCVFKSHKELAFEFTSFYVPKIGCTSLTIPVFYLFNKTIFMFFTKKGNKTINECAR